jgi:acetyl esterase/lipase
MARESNRRCGRIMGQSANGMRPFVRPIRRLVLAAAIASVVACNPLYYVGLKFVYRRANLPSGQILRNVAYEPTASNPRETLDLFLPPGTGWPVVVFVHGGSWTSGDKDLRVGGADVYDNIGRFLASRGIGAAVIEYRLIPAVDWREQAADVARAVGWVYRTIPVYGGRRDRIVLMGHSAGAQLAVRTALDDHALGREGVPAAAIAGVIAVSGAGYDLTDAETYHLGNDPAFYAARFQRNASDVNWQAEASPIGLMRPGAPPFLIVYAGGETKPLQRQSRLLNDAAIRAGVTTRLLDAPGLSHTRIVPTLSRADRPAGAAILEFLEGLPRPRTPPETPPTARRESRPGENPSSSNSIE